MARPARGEHSVQPVAGKRQAATAKGKAKACFELDIRIRDRFPSLPGLIVCLPPVT
jgi:hypothetical protein